MKNVEKYEKEISKLVNEDNILHCAIATVAGLREEKLVLIRTAKDVIRNVLSGCIQNTRNRF